MLKLTFDERAMFHGRVRQVLYSNGGRILLLLTVVMGRDGTTPKTAQPRFENSPPTGSFSSREALVQPEFGLLPKI
ncbi:MAG: hypothetical protein AUJ07_05595 [Crenarchaeota archaeon 13_1_40CM_3_53_5]|nr:MAG: hypothetical protein AUJ07_05595 [Crenarchaeota archaeon 13_1_40CM_3_53_5]